MLPTTLSVSALLAAPVMGRTIHSVLVVSMNGDRTSQVFPGHQMTSLGAQQCYDSGSLYRDQYIASNSSLLGTVWASQISGISPDAVDPTQIWASAPDETVLFQTATNLLQGLYPPYDQLNPSGNTQELANGTMVSTPPNGHQHVHVHGVADDSPDTIWLQGSNNCPAYTRAAETYRESHEYQATLENTEEFYSQFDTLLGPIIGTDNVSYARAYDVYDLLNTATLQNASVADQIDPEDLKRARFLAFQSERNMNYNLTRNTSMPDRSIGGESFIGGVLNHMQSVIDNRAATKFSLMTVSHRTLLTFAAITLVDQLWINSSLPDDASSFAFELFSDADNSTFPVENVDEDLLIGLRFRNGTDGGLFWISPFGGTVMDVYGISYSRFKTLFEPYTISDVETWCQRCGSQADFCLAANATRENETSSAAASAGRQDGGGGISASAAGGIGAGLTLAVVAAVAFLVWVFMRSRKAKVVAQDQSLQKTISDSDSEGV